MPLLLPPDGVQLPEFLFIAANHASPLLCLGSFHVLMYSNLLIIPAMLSDLGLLIQICKSDRSMQNTQHCACTGSQCWLFVVTVNNTIINIWKVRLTQCRRQVLSHVITFIGTGQTLVMRSLTRLPFCFHL